MSLKYETIRYPTKIVYKRHGERHRVNAPSMIHYYGDLVWHQYGQIHRLDGPAEIFCGSKQYFIRGSYYPKNVYDIGIRNYYLRT